MVQQFRICLLVQETRVQTVGSGRSSGEGNRNPFQYGCLGNPMGRGASGLKSMVMQGVGHDLVARKQQ